MGRRHLFSSALRTASSSHVEMGNMCSRDPDISSTHQLHPKDAPPPLPRRVGGFVLKATTNNEKSFLPSEPKCCASKLPEYDTDVTHPPTPRDSAAFDDVFGASDPPGYTTDEAQRTHPTTPQSVSSPEHRAICVHSVGNAMLPGTFAPTGHGADAPERTHPPTPRGSVAETDMLPGAIEPAGYAIDEAQRTHPATPGPFSSPEHGAAACTIGNDMSSNASAQMTPDQPLQMDNEDTQMHGLRKSERELTDTVRGNRESIVKLRARLSESSERHKDRLLSPRSSS